MNSQLLFSRLRASFYLTRSTSLHWDTERFLLLSLCVLYRAKKRRTTFIYSIGCQLGSVVWRGNCQRVIRLYSLIGWGWQGECCWAESTVGSLSDDWDLVDPLTHKTAVSPFLFSNPKYYVSGDLTISPKWLWWILINSRSFNPWTATEIVVTVINS